MSVAVLSIGSNLGDRLANLQAALDSLRPWVSAVSSVYETAPWGPVPQGDYLNAIVVAADPTAAATDWLARAQLAEDSAGRTREVRWGPRTLDVDVVTVDDEVSDDRALTLPHPRAAQRAFVLVPWLEVDPAAVLGGTSVKQLVHDLDPDDVDGVHRRPEVALT